MTDPVLENYEESRLGTEAHGHVFDERPGWPTLDTAPLLQCPASTPQDDETYEEFLRDYTHYPSDYYHLPPDDFQRCYENNSSANTTTALSDVKDILDGHQDYPEEMGLPASCPPSPRPPSDGHDSLSPDGSTLRPGSPSVLFVTASDLRPLHSLDQDIDIDPLCFSQGLSQTPTPTIETNVTTGTSHIFVPFSGYHPPIGTPPLSRTDSQPVHSISDYEVLPVTMPIRGPMQDSRTATDTFDEMEMHSLSSSQAPSLHTYSAVYPQKTTLNFYRPLTRHSPYDEVAQSDFRLERRGRQLASTNASIPLRNRTPRNSNTYRCHPCNTTFSQKQGFNRHLKDVHLHRNLCPYCNDFEWSQGRYYKFRAHLTSEHPGAAVPTPRS